MSDMANNINDRAEDGGDVIAPPWPLRPHDARNAEQDAKRPKAETDPDDKRGKRPSGDHRKPARAHRHKGVAALVVFCCLILATYVGGVLVFSRTCYPNTVVADADISWLDRDSSIARVRSSAEDYVLTIEGDGFSWRYEAERASDVIDAAAAVDRVIAQNKPLLWPVRLAKGLLSPLGEGDQPRTADVESDSKGPELDDIPLPTSFDRSGFLASLNAAIEEFNASRPGTLDAVSSYDAENGVFSLDRALSNRKLDVEAIDRAALLAVSALNSDVKLTDDSFTPLANGADEEELQKALDSANELIGTDVNLKMGGAAVATLDGATLATWIAFDDSLNPTLNTESVSQWVHDLAATQLDTVGSERTYTRADGKTISVRGGTYGWMSDESQLTQMLHDAVANKQVGDIDIPLKHSAASWNGAGRPDWGAYCDIDLSEQHARYYDASGNLVWESGCITGNPNTGNATPTGVYALNAKARNSTLIGLDEDHDGEPDYKTPVSYWMPFVGNAIGMHDANWQSSASFSNPNAYTWTGSHGCVNLPPDRAAALFEVISQGDCVIVHN